MKGGISEVGDICNRKQRDFRDGLFKSWKNWSGEGI